MSILQLSDVNIDRIDKLFKIDSILHWPISLSGKMEGKSCVCLADIVAVVAFKAYLPPPADSHDRTT